MSVYRTTAATAAGVAILASASNAAWLAVGLRPDSIVYSAAYAVTADYQAGYIYQTSGVPFRSPVLWYGSAASAQRIAGATDGMVKGAWREIKVGHVLDAGAGTGRATAWIGVQNSPVDLHPPGTFESDANAVWDDLVVGLVRSGGYKVARWSLGSGTWTDLTPAGMQGMALGVDSSGIVGNTWVGTASTSATFWSLQGAVTSLHPQDAYGSSANDIWAGWQVGYVQLTQESSLHAALWNGSPQSFIDLNPPGARGSSLRAVHDGVEGGSAAFDLPTGSYSHAGVWFGTPESFVDLHPYLDPVYFRSSINDLYVDDIGNITAVGEAWRKLPNGTERVEAVMWRYIVPEPGSLVGLLAGLSSLVVAMRRRR